MAFMGEKPAASTSTEGERTREKASQKIRAKGGVARKKRARAARGKTTTVIAFPTERKLGSSNKI